MVHGILNVTQYVQDTPFFLFLPSSGRIMGKIGNLEMIKFNLTQSCIVVGIYDHYIIL